MSMTSEQKREVETFQQSLSREDEWLFYHLAWATGETDTITYEDKYEIMKKWDSLKG